MRTILTIVLALGLVFFISNYDWKNRRVMRQLSFLAVIAIAYYILYRLFLLIDVNLIELWESKIDIRQMVIKMLQE